MYAHGPSSFSVAIGECVVDLDPLLGTDGRCRAATPGTDRSPAWSSLAGETADSSKPAVSAGSCCTARGVSHARRPLCACAPRDADVY
jgi:hypothetical protein